MRIITASPTDLIKSSYEQGLAQKVALETATDHEEKNHQYLSDFLGKAALVKL